MDKAIFLDRDGTINEDVGDLWQKEKLVLIPHAIEALMMLQKNFSLFIITNQSGIAKKQFSETEYAEFNAYFSKKLSQEGIIIKEILHCPHKKEDNCFCHKPSTYFIERLQKKYNLDLKNSFCIGDHPHDIDMAKRAGTGSVYLLTGHGSKHRNELILNPDYVANSIYEAAVWINEIFEHHELG